MTEMSWGFPLSQGLYHRARELNAQIKAENKAMKSLNKTLAEIVRELLQEGLQAYVYRPAETITMSSGKRSAIDSGGKVVAGAVNVVINQFFGALDLGKLQAVAGYIDALLWPPVTGEPARLMFALEPPLRAQLWRQLEGVRTGEGGPGQVDALTASLKRVVDTCIDHYYQQPVDLVDLKGMRRSASAFAMRTVEKAFDALLERLLTRLDSADLMQLAVYLESLLQEPCQQRRVS